MKAWQENQLQSLVSTQSNQELFKTIVEASKELEFEHCAYGIRAPLPLTNPKTMLINNYPTSWKSRYQEHNYLTVDPTVRLAIRSPKPIVWTEDLFVSAREFWEEAHAFGLCHGWAQSIHDCNGVIGMLTLSRSKMPITEAELHEKRFRIAWLTQMAHLQMSPSLTPQIMPEVEIKLSLREREVLRWTADGKTSSEISVILNISERTVNFHITNSVTKLNATNKISAAIKAAVMGMI